MNTQFQSQNFFKVASGQDTFPILHQLQIKQWLWDQVPVRTQHEGTVHAQVSDILLRYQELENRSMDEIQADLECRAYDPWFVLPQAASLVMALMARVGGTRLGRVIITKLPPGKSVLPHTDDGLNAEYYQRYHVALLNSPGAVFNIGDESMVFNTGDIWWINNQEIHDVVNNSATDRIAMIVDIRVE